MNNLALVLNASNEDIIEDDNNCTVIIDASDVPEIVSDIEQKTNEWVEVSEVMESLYSTYTLIKESLDSGNITSVHANIVRYEECVSVVSNKLGIDRTPNFHTESLTMTELWKYSAEDGFIDSIKDKIIAFFKWVSEKISIIIKAINTWFAPIPVSSASSANDTKNTDKLTKNSNNSISDVESKIKEVKSSSENSYLLHLSGKMGHGHIGNEFKSVSEIKHEYGVLEDLFKSFGEFTAEITTFVSTMDKTKAIDSNEINNKILAIVESRRNSLHGKEAFCYKFNSKIVNNRVELLYFTYKDNVGSSIKNKEYTMPCNKNEIMDILESRNRVNKIVMDYVKHISNLKKEFDDLGKHLIGEKDGDLMSDEFKRVRESISVIGKLVGTLLSSVKIIHINRPKYSVVKS